MIYSIDDLCNTSYDNEQIEDVSKNLMNSLIIAMFRCAKIYDLDDNEILDIVKRDDEWFNKYSWTQSQRIRFINKLNKVFSNLYYFGPNKCQNSSIEWVIKYGFRNKEMKMVSSNKKYKKSKR